MASTLLEVFRSHRIRLFPHHALIRDLGRLTIVEKSYGYRLEAVRDTHGHADLATALAIALPLAVEKSGKRKIILQVSLDHDPVDPYTSPFAAACMNFEKRQREFDEEQDWLAEPEDPMEGFTEGLRDALNR